MNPSELPRPAPLTVKVEEAARILGVSRSRLYLLLAQGEIASISVGRSRLVPLESLQNFVTMRATARPVNATGGES